MTCSCSWLVWFFRGLAWYTFNTCESDKKSQSSKKHCLLVCPRIHNCRVQCFILIFISFFPVDHDQNYVDIIQHGRSRMNWRRRFTTTSPTFPNVAPRVSTRWWTSWVRSGKLWALRKKLMYPRLLGWNPIFFGGKVEGFRLPSSPNHECVLSGKLSPDSPAPGRRSEFWVVILLPSGYLT